MRRRIIAGLEVPSGSPSNARGVPCPRATARRRCRSTSSVPRHQGGLPRLSGCGSDSLRFRNSPGPRWGGLRRCRSRVPKSSEIRRGHVRFRRRAGRAADFSVEAGAQAWSFRARRSGCLDGEDRWEHSLTVPAHKELAGDLDLASFSAVGASASTDDWLGRGC